MQYKNYHAEHIPPYPEDSKVAEWVMEYAEPNGIVSNVKRIYVDNTPLVKKGKPSSTTDQTKKEQITTGKDEKQPDQIGKSITDPPKNKNLGPTRATI